MVAYTKHNNLSPEKRYINEVEASRITGLSRAWFQRKRWQGGGIPYVKCGSRVLYDIKVVESFLQERTMTNTSEASEGICN